jgi:hypothetical protein
VNKKKQKNFIPLGHGMRQRQRHTQPPKILVMPAKAGISTHGPVPLCGKEKFFCEQKKQKNFCPGPWVEAMPAPHALSQGSKSFLLLFFKKEALTSLPLPSLP